MLHLVAAGRAEVACGGWTARTLSRPADGHPAGGDRAALAWQGGRLRCLLADAAGHGARGAEVWRAAGEPHAAWLEPGWEGRDLREGARTVNASLRVAGQSACCVVADLQPHGALRYALLGWGCHALAVTAEGPWRPPEPLEASGLKLGWLAPDDWEQTPRAWVTHAPPLPVERLVLLSDGLLADDHRDPMATWAHLDALCAGVAGRPAADVLPWLLEQDPGNGDDLTLVQLDRGSPG